MSRKTLSMSRSMSRSSSRSKSRTRSKSRSMSKSGTRARSNHGGMFGRASGAAAAPAPAPLTFAAMDAAAAATTDHDKLEAIRLTKEIIRRASVSFREHGGVDYLNLETGWDTLTPIWQLIGLMKRRVAFAARHRDVMLASSAALCDQPLPPSSQPNNPTIVSPKERMSALGAMQRAMIMRQLTHGIVPHAHAARKMTDCMTQYQASQVNHGMSIAVENALRTIETIKSVGWKRQMVTHMMFPVDIRPLVPKSIMMEYPLAQFVASYVKKPFSQIGRTYQELQRTALQKLCDTLMPNDILVAVATKIEYDALQPSGDYFPARDH